MRPSRAVNYPQFPSLEQVPAAKRPYGVGSEAFKLSNLTSALSPIQPAGS